MAREQEKKNKLSILENVHKQQTTKEEDNG